MIRKKRIEDTVIILVGSKLLTFEKVADEQWIKACAIIDDIHQVIDKVFEHGMEHDTDFVKEVHKLPEYNELIETLDYRIREAKIREEESRKAVIDSLDLEGTVEERMVTAKKIADISGLFEYDTEGITYLKGFRHPMPRLLVEALLDANYNPESEFTIKSLVNFWKYLLLNPDKHVREGLFAWIKTSNFSITEEGNIIAYRNVDVKHVGFDKKFEDFIHQSYAKIKRWKKSPKNYSIYEVNGQYDIAENDKQVNAKLLGVLSDLHDSVSADVFVKTVYTDQHSRTMEITIGEPVSMNRSECDNDPNAACSRGLHNKSSKYSLNLGSDLLVTLVNPYNVVAIPSYDTTKFRSCEYLPIAKAEVDENGKMVEFDAGTYDIPYNGAESIVKLLETRSLSELKSEGLISDEITNDDFAVIMEEAIKVVDARVVKLY